MRAPARLGGSLGDAGGTGWRHGRRGLVAGYAAALVVRCAGCRRPKSARNGRPRVAAFVSISGLVTRPATHDVRQQSAADCFGESSTCPCQRRAHYAARVYITQTVDNTLKLMGRNLVGAPRSRPSNVWIWAATGVVFVGALFFGFASCGGYAWYKQVFCVSVTVAAIAAVVVPSQLLPTITRKGTFLATLFFGFFLVEAAVAPFYPGPPDSLRQYEALFLESLEFGPCR